MKKKLLIAASVLLVVLTVITCVDYAVSRKTMELIMDSRTSAEGPTGRIWCYELTEADKRRVARSFLFAVKVNEKTLANLTRNKNATCPIMLICGDKPGVEILKEGLEGTPVIQSVYYPGSNLTAYVMYDSSDQATIKVALSRTGKIIYEHWKKDFENAG